MNANASVRVVIEIVPFQVHVVEGEDFLTTEFIAYSTTSALDADGAVLLQTKSHVSRSVNAQVALNAQVGLYAELSINADATLTLCRPTSCHRLPDWLRMEYVVYPNCARGTKFSYSCYQHDFAPAVRDQYGIIAQNMINLMARVLNGLLHCV